MNQPTVSFTSQEEWSKWLKDNYDTSNGVWIRFYKKSSGLQTFNCPQALEEALCYGWIDGQRKSNDKDSFLQKYTPRRKRSVWSKINTQHIEKLTKLGRMKPSGLLEVECAKSDGRWDAAYESPSNMTPPKEFLDALSKNKKAKDFYATLNKTNTFAISWQIHTAKKKETKTKRIEKFISMLEQGKKPY